jgi:hypothetical protein
MKILELANKVVWTVQRGTDEYRHEAASKLPFL